MSEWQTECLFKAWDVPYSAEEQEQSKKKKVLAAGKHIE